jgi:hypothetical protein
MTSKWQRIDDDDTDPSPHSCASVLQSAEAKVEFAASLADALRQPQSPEAKVEFLARLVDASQQPQSPKAKTADIAAILADRSKQTQSPEAKVEFLARLVDVSKQPQSPKAKAADLAASLADALKGQTSTEPNNVADLVEGLTDALKGLRADEVCESRFQNLSDARAALEERQHTAAVSELRAELGAQQAATLELEAKLLQGKSALFSPAGLRLEQTEFRVQQEMKALRAQLETQESYKDFEQEQAVRQLRAQLEMQQANRRALEARREFHANRSIAGMHAELAEQAARILHDRETSTLQHREELAMIAEYDRKRNDEASEARCEAQRERERRLGLPNRVSKTSTGPGNSLANTAAELTATLPPPQQVQAEACVDALSSSVAQDSIIELQRAVSELRAKLLAQGDPRVDATDAATAEPQAEPQPKAKATSKANATPKAKGKAKVAPKAKGKAKAKGK